MIALDDIKSGFDIELLLGEEYIKYLLLNSVDIGDFETTMSFVVPVGNADVPLDIVLKIPENIKRDYDVNPNAIMPLSTDLGSFEVEILDDNQAADIQIIFIADITLGAPLNYHVEDDTLTIDATFNLVEIRNEDSNELEDVEMQFNVVHVTSADQFLNTLIQARLQEIIDLINDQLEGTFGTNLFGASDGVQQVLTRKFTNNENKRAFGIYMNLLMQNGPDKDSFEPTRGNVNNGINFLPIGKDLAFGINPNLFELLEEDFKYKFAEESSEGSDKFEIKQDGEVIGTLKDIKLKVAKDKYTLPDGSKSDKITCLQIIIKIDSKIYGADAKITINLFPIIKDKLLEWEMDYKVNIDALFEALPFFVFYGLTLILGIPGLIISGILAGVILVVQEAVIEPLVEDKMDDEIEGQGDEATSLFNLIPHRTEIAKKRWDPFYATKHQILTPIDFWQLENEGLAFCGNVKLAKQYEPLKSTVLRSEKRANKDAPIQYYQFRIKDHENKGDNFALDFLASDYEHYTYDEEDEETNLFLLTPSELNHRVQLDKIRRRITYQAEKVHIVNNQVNRILSISDTEIAEGEKEIKKRYEREEKDKILNERGDELREEAIEALSEGNDDVPTENEIEDKIDKLIKKDLKKQVEQREEDDLENDIANYINENIRLDLTPHEYGSLHANGMLLAIKRFDLINREGRYYYRDKADRRIEDNLMSLPKY